MTRRRSTYRSLASLERDLRGCRACVEAGHPLESLPVLAPLAGQRAYLFGQAPGIQEGVERRPWRGRAGQTLRRWLELDEDDVLRDLLLRFGDALLPGPRRPGAAIARPTPEEQRLCAFWRERELAILRPRADRHGRRLAARRLLGLTSVTEASATRYELDDGTPSRSRCRTRPARAAGSTCPRTARGVDARGRARPRRARRLDRCVAWSDDAEAPALPPTFLRLLGFLRPYQAVARPLDRARVALARRVARVPVADRERRRRDPLDTPRPSSPG